MSQILNLKTASQLLLQGEIVAFPTETVYGLGALANNLEAVNRVFAIKNRPRDNPLICHFYEINQIKKFAKVNPLSDTLLQKFAPGALSLLLPLIDQSLSPATCGSAKIVCRIPNHQLTLSLLKMLKTPLVGPSANTSGFFSPTCAEMVLCDLGGKISGVLDGGNCQIGLESTIIEVIENQILILRSGIIGKTEIENYLKTLNLDFEFVNSENYKLQNCNEKTPKSDQKILLKMPKNLRNKLENNSQENLENNLEMESNLEKQRKTESENKPQNQEFETKNEEKDLEKNVKNSLENNLVNSWEKLQNLENTEIKQHFESKNSIMKNEKNTQEIEKTVIPGQKYAHYRSKTPLFWVNEKELAKILSQNLENSQNLEKLDDKTQKKITQVPSKIEIKTQPKFEKETENETQNRLENGNSQNLENLVKNDLKTPKIVIITTQNQIPKLIKKFPKHQFEIFETDSQTQKSEIGQNLETEKDDEKFTKLQTNSSNSQTNSHTNSKLELQTLQTNLENLQNISDLKLTQNFEQNSEQNLDKTQQIVIENQTQNQIQILNLGANIGQINQNFYKTLFKLDKIQTNDQTLKIGYLLLPKSEQNSAKIALLDKVEKACQKLK